MGWDTFAEGPDNSALGLNNIAKDWNKGLKTSVCHTKFVNETGSGILAVVSKSKVR